MYLSKNLSKNLSKTLQFNKSEIQFKLHSNLQKPQLMLPKILEKAQQELQRVQ